MSKSLRVFDDYGMIGRRVHGRQITPKHISEEDYSGLTPPTPIEPPIIPPEPGVTTAFLVDSDGAFLTDSDNAFLMEPV